METDPQNKRKALLWLILLVQRIHVHKYLFPFSYSCMGEEWYWDETSHTAKHSEKWISSRLDPTSWSVRSAQDLIRETIPAEQRQVSAHHWQLVEPKDLSQGWKLTNCSNRGKDMVWSMIWSLLSGGASPSCSSREATSLQLKIQLPTLSYPFGGRSCNILLDAVTVSSPSGVASWNVGSNKSVPEGLGSSPCRGQVLGQGSSQGCCRSTGRGLTQIPPCQQCPVTPGGLHSL